jgi:hypothetical protein
MKHFFEIARNTLSRFGMVLGLAIQLKKITYEGKAYKKTVLFECLRNDPFFEVFCLLVAFFLSQRKIKVYILKDNNWLCHYDNKRRKKGNENLKKLLKPVSFRARILRRIVTFPMRWKLRKKVKYLYYDQIISKELLGQLKTKKLNNHKNFGSFKNVDSSHKRFFGGRAFNPANDEHIYYADLSFRNQMINEAICQAILKKVKPDLFCTLDGIYSSYGSLVDEFNKSGTQVFAYQPMTIRDRSVRIGHIHSCVNNISPLWYSFKENSYNAQNRNNSAKYFQKRFEPKTRSPEEDETLINISSQKIKYQKVIGLFPNLTWDGAIKERDRAFTGLHDWLVQTIKWAVDKPYLIILREHPQSPEKYNPYESSISLVEELLGDLGEIANLITISGLNDTSSYTLVREINDVSVVYDGTLGIEISYMGYPVVFAGNSPYSKKGIGFEAYDKGEYFCFLDNLSKKSSCFRDKKNSIMSNSSCAAAFQFDYNTYYVPIMPKRKKAIQVESRYWQPWEISTDKLDPNKCLNWRRTLDRFFYGWTNDPPVNLTLENTSNDL